MNDETGAKRGYQLNPPPASTPNPDAAPGIPLTQARALTWAAPPPPPRFWHCRSPALCARKIYQPGRSSSGAVRHWLDDRVFPPRSSPRKPRPPPAGAFFSQSGALPPAGSPVERRPYARLMCRRRRGARRRYRVAAGAPVRQLLAGEALGHSADACALDPSINPP